MGILVSIGLVVFVVPLLGFIAILNEVTYWPAASDTGPSPADEIHIRRTARRFLVCSMLFAVICLLLVTFVRAIMKANLPLLPDMWLFVMALLAVGMSIISHRLFARISARLGLRCGAFFPVIVSFGAVIAVFSSTSVGNYLIQRYGYSKVAETFSGDSNSLELTTIVPTLDSPCPESKNVIWCSSFQLAWNRMRDDLIGAPVEVVGAFGVWGYDSRYKRMREQVEILYLHEDREATDRDQQMKEFAVDLCRHSGPYQVVAAVVEPKDSLAQTLDYVRSQIADSRQDENYERTSLLDDVDVLMVPEMFWEIDHRFDELIGKSVSNANPAMPIVEARQAIKFRLDRFGAMLESEATIGVFAIPRHFKFNRPFVVYMKKRECEQPFFVMWVDNAELLNKK